MADEILARFSRRVAKLELLPSGGGVFVVTVDGKEIFNKDAAGRFPEEGEIAGILSRPARGAGGKR